MSWRLNLLPALSLLGFLGPAIHAEPGSCPSVLSEAPPYGDPPHSAQLQIVQHPDCPFIDRVTAVLYSGDERLTSRTYFEDSIAASPLRFPIADSVELPERAGLLLERAQLDFPPSAAPLTRVGNIQAPMGVFGVSLFSHCSSRPMDLDLDTVLRWLVYGLVALIGLSLLGVLVDVASTLLWLILKAGVVVLVVLFIIRLLGGSED